MHFFKSDSNSYFSRKIAKLSNPIFFATMNERNISVKVGQNVNLLFIFTHIKTLSARQKLWFNYLEITLRTKSFLLVSLVHICELGKRTVMPHYG